MSTTFERVQVSERCFETSELLQFYLQAGDIIADLRNRLSEGDQLTDRKLLYAQIAVLDDAINLHWNGKAAEAVDFLESLSAAALSPEGMFEGIAQ